MRKLCLLLSLFGVLACRSRGEATQTVVYIRAARDLLPEIKRVDYTIYALPGPEKVPHDVPSTLQWPVKLTFVPKSASAKHAFTLSFTAFDGDNQPLAKIELDSVIVEGHSRYISINLDKQCMLTHCPAEGCRRTVSAQELSKTQEDALSHQWYCEQGQLERSLDGSPENAPQTPTGPGGMVVTGKSNVQGGSLPTAGNLPIAGGSAAPSGNASPTNSTTQPAVNTVDASVAPANGSDCHDASCCPQGFELDATTSTCVVRNDCTKDNGGCEDQCERSATGEAKCSCSDPNTWLKSDGKQCGELQAEAALTTSAGSVKRTRPQVAFDESGNGVVVWAETADSGTTSLWYARYHAETASWDKPAAPFVPNAANASELTLALDAKGSGLLLWTATVNDQRQLWAARFRSGAYAFKAVRVDGPNDGDAYMPALSLDAAGDGLIAWTEFLSPGSALRVARYHASSGNIEAVPATPAVPPGAPETDSIVLRPMVALDDTNHGLIAWSRVPIISGADGGWTLNPAGTAAFQLRFDDSLGPALTFDASQYPSAQPDVAVDAHGNGVAVWLQARDPTASTVSVVSRAYVPKQGWNMQDAHTLSNTANPSSVPAIVMAPDGTAFSAWQETLTNTAQSGLKIRTRGALRVADTFLATRELGEASDAPFWTAAANTQSWSADAAADSFDRWEPSLDLAVGPNHEGFVVGAKYQTLPSSVSRRLWLQRVGSQHEPSAVLFVTAVDSVPDVPSAPKLALNANGDGAIVWDRQDPQKQGRYFVFANLLQ